MMWFRKCSLWLHRACFWELQFLDPAYFNNTPKAQMEIVYFNRVPKVGSTKMMTLLDHLANVNNFSHVPHKMGKYMRVTLTDEEEEEAAEAVADLKEPAAFTQHVNFVDFEKYDLPRPIYINLVRDPIERTISWFQYVRTPWYYLERQKIFPNLEIPEKKWFQMTFDQCIVNRHSECIFDQDSMVSANEQKRQMLFFCGHDVEECIPFNSESSLQRAKDNVHKHYAVVGSWEDTNVTLTVLEHYIPRFFRNALEVYYRNEDKIKDVNKNTVKQEVREEVKSFMRKKFSREIEFYQFCKQRLYKQYLAIRLKQIQKKEKEEADQNIASIIPAL